MAISAFFFNIFPFSSVGGNLMHQLNGAKLYDLIQLPVIFFFDYCDPIGVEELLLSNVD